MANVLQWPVQSSIPAGGLTRINWAHPIASGLCACWLLNEGAGKAAIDLTGNFVGAFEPSASPTWSASRGTGAVVEMAAGQYIKCFNGKDREFLFPPDGASIYRFSVGFWVNRNADRNVDAGVGRTNAGAPAPFDFLCFSGLWQFYVGNGVVNNFAQANSVAGPGAWEFIVGTCDGPTGATELWMQGQLQNTSGSAALGQKQGDAHNVFIGSREDHATGLDGFISQVMVWNRVLMAPEIAQLYADPYCFLTVPSSLCAPTFFNVGVSVVGAKIIFRNRDYV